MANSSLVTEENYNVGGHLTYGRQGTKIDRIVLHHNASTSDNIPGVWQNRAASAHYQVTPNAIRQCVDEGNTAWHAGNWAMNLRSIGIEHLNSSGAPNWDVADETEERSAALVADACKRHGIPCDRGHILGHNEVSATACPGGLDVDKIVRRANEIMGGASANIPAAPSTPPVTESTSTGWCYFDYRGNVRQQPTTESAIMATYNAGTWVEYVGFVHGQTVNGSDKWLKSKIHGWYVHESVTGGTWGLKDLGSVNAGGGKSLDAIANEVIAGQWGNGDDRRNRLQAAGYDYNAVQALVNQKLGMGSAPAGKSNEQIADEVIRGEWGNGDDRRNRLQAAGYDYNAIQAIVNRKLG